MSRYKLRPEYVEAFQWNPDVQKADPKWILDAISRGAVKFVVFDATKGRPARTFMTIVAKDGVYHAVPSDYIIRDCDGNIYPCSAKIFEKKYLKINEEND